MSSCLSINLICLFLLFTNLIFHNFYNFFLIFLLLLKFKFWIQHFDISYKTDLIWYNSNIFISYYHFELYFLQSLAILKNGQWNNNDPLFTSSDNLFILVSKPRRLLSAGLKPVLSQNEKAWIASNFREFFTNIELKILKLIPD